MIGMKKKSPQVMEPAVAESLLVHIAAIEADVNRITVTNAAKQRISDSCAAMRRVIQVATQQETTQ